MLQMQYFYNYSRTICPSKFCKFCYTLFTTHGCTCDMLRASHIISSNIRSITLCLMCWIALGYITIHYCGRSEWIEKYGWVAITFENTSAVATDKAKTCHPHLQVSNIAIHVWCKPLNFWRGYDRLIQKNTKITSL